MMMMLDPADLGPAIIIEIIVLTKRMPSVVSMGSVRLLAMEESMLAVFAGALEGDPVLVEATSRLTVMGTSSVPVGPRLTVMGTSMVPVGLGMEDTALRDRRAAEAGLATLVALMVLALAFPFPSVVVGIGSPTLLFLVAA